MEKTERPDDHEKFLKLCALAQANSLSTIEELELEAHLKICASCREVYAQYSVIGKEGMAFLSAEFALAEEAESWDSGGVRQKLLSAIRGQGLRKISTIKPTPPRSAWKRPPSISRNVWAWGSLAACTVLALTVSAYRMGERRNSDVPQLSASLPVENPNPAAEKAPAVDLSSAQAVQISRMEKQIASEQGELERLRAASLVADQRVNELGTAMGQKEVDLRQLTDERDQLASRLSEKEKAFETLQADYSSFRADHNRSLLHMASLESEVTDLQAASRDQATKLKDAEQFLASDRDIRELMGARKLYIADVFDVDSASHTRKPFGRVFYTQSKSLVFYAYDLDHQPGVKNASVFQVWGQRDAEANSTQRPMNLGILYMDSESNRRWVLRSDDPKQLAEIDAVFVTVEPHGGSQKPTGKPLLYALLRKEANHP